MTRQDKSIPKPFEGFDQPESNWFRMPNSWTDMTAGINSIAELKIVEYILRHTWGYQEYALKKHITIDEFVNGRRRQDGSRMDSGTGLSERAVYDGIRKAVEDGLIEEETDSSDRGRVKKYFSLHMRDSLAETTDGTQLQTLQGRVQSLPSRGANSAPRSEKETLERIGLSNIRKTSTNLKNADKTKTSDQHMAIAFRRRATPESAPTPVATIGAAIVNSAAGRLLREHESPSNGRGGGQPDRQDELALGSVGQHATVSPSAAGRGQLRRVPHQDEVYQIIQAYIADFARELNDKAPLKASTTRAYNLYKRSGLGQDAFVAQLYAARSIVKEQAGNIRSRGANNAAGFPVAHGAAYYFAVLEDLLGLRQAPGAKATGVENSLRLTESSPSGSTGEHAEGPLRPGWSKLRT